jgi:tRNA A37 threonylcarbamoyladenosine synthetase subunit TsaC/SUA5/YrdC
MAGHLPMLELKELNLQGHEVALVIDSGVITPAEKSSQVEIDLTWTRLVREGAISKSEIQKVIPALVIA